MIGRIASRAIAAAGLVAALMTGSIAVGTVASASAAVPAAEDSGFVFVNAAGSVVAKGSARNFGSKHVAGVVGIAATSNGKGYWVATKNGSVYAFGGARFGAKRNLSHIVGIAGRPGSTGYWLVSSTGRVYAFGGAKNYGSIKKKVTGVIGIAPTRDGGGYWITTNTGQMFHYGDAKGIPGKKLKGIVAITANASKGGFWLLRNNGQVYRFGSAPYYGQTIAKGTVSMAATPDGKGYWVLTAHGAVSAHGDAVSYGGRAGTGIVAISAVPSSAARLAVATKTMVSGTQGNAYTMKLATSGGTGAVTWRRAAGKLPPGVTLTSTGTLQGKATKMGTYSVEFIATDSSTPREKAGKIVSIKVGPPVMQIASVSLPIAFTDLAYSASLTATDAVGPLTWSRTGGSLPAGLTLSPAGKITGTVADSAATGALTTATIRVSDPQGQVATGTLTMLVEPTLTDPGAAGYVAAGGPFTKVQGTFNVPSLTSAATAGEGLQIAVGLADSDDDGELQAGVSLAPSTDSSAPAGTVEITPWWEVENGDTTSDDTTSDPSSLTVESGDEITVLIQEVSSGEWLLTISDDTTGKAVSDNDVAYSGSPDTADWLVATPDDEDADGTAGADSLAPFTPNVTFTNLDLSEAYGVGRVVMVQDDGEGNQVQAVTPSALNVNATAFRVAYGPTAPAAP